MAYQFVREPLLREDVEKLNQACDCHYEKLIVWTLLDTGLRVGELCALTPNNILWQEHVLRINGKGGPYGKMTKKRVVPMTPRVQALLEHYFSMNEEWPYSVRGVQNIVKRVANKARISKPVSPHVLRHTFATFALQRGISIAAVQKLLGHDRLSTTAIYLNLTDTHLVEEFRAKW
jgi:integrase/recombinase XerD